VFEVAWNHYNVWKNIIVIRGPETFALSMKVFFFGITETFFTFDEMFFLVKDIH
jgi:hypothetical protein